MEHSRFWLLGALLVTVSTAALAVADWTNAGQITLINQQPAGPWVNYVFIEVSGITYNPSDASACFTRNGFYFSITDDRKKRLFATLLAAQLASKSVRVYATGNCHPWGHAEIDGVVVQ